MGFIEVAFFKVARLISIFSAFCIGEYREAEGRASMVELLQTILCTLPKNKNLYQVETNTNTLNDRKCINLIECK